MDYKKIFFIYKNPTDPIDIVRKAREDYSCDAISYCIYDGIKPMNLKEAQDIWLPAILKHAEGKLGVFAYQCFEDSDPQKQFNKIKRRIAPYIDKLAGLQIYFSPLFTGSGRAIQLMNMLRTGFPDLRLDTVITEGFYIMAASKEICSMSDHTYQILTAKTDLWAQYHSAYVWNELKVQPLKKGHEIYPMISVTDQPLLNYKMQVDEIKKFWHSLNTDETPSCGIWNWYPKEAVAHIAQDGEKPTVIKQLLKSLVWQKVLPEIPPVIEPPVVVPPVVTPPVTPKENNMILGYDYWEGNFEVDELRISSLIKFMYIRMNDMNGGHHLDERFLHHWLQAAGYNRFPYFVYNPWVSGRQNYDYFRSILPADAPLRFALDVEVRYKDYSPVTYAQQVEVFIKEAVLDKLKPAIYTGAGYLDLLSYWSKTVPYIWARYPSYMQPTNPETFERLQAKVNGLVWNPDGRYSTPPAAANLQSPAEIKIWQVSDQWKLDGTGNNTVDINVWKGSYQELVDWISAPTVVVTPEPAADRAPALIAELEAVLGRYK